MGQDVSSSPYEQKLNTLTDLIFESKYEEALSFSDNIINSSYTDRDWYAYFTSKIRKANVLSMLSRTQESQVMLEGIVDSIQTLVGDPSTVLRECYHVLGECMGNQGKLVEQHTYFEQALQTHNQLPDGKRGNLFERAILYNNLAFSYGEQGDLGKQLEWMKMAIQHPLPQTKQDSFYQALFQHNLGYTHFTRGEYNEALPYLETGKEKWQEIYGPNYFYLSYSYNALASCYTAKKAYHQALLLHEKSQDIRIQNVGEKHPLIAACQNNMGIIYLTLNEYDKATQHFRRAMNIRMDQSSPNWPLIATHMQNIAVAYFRQIESYTTYKDSVEKYLAWAETLRTEEHSLNTSH
ncbi:MAG: tetratricopeptide repeat protein, partial [Bacteroidota bacterium]